MIFWKNEGCGHEIDGARAGFHARFYSEKNGTAAWPQDYLEIHFAK
jgi:hypothetical protein